MTVPAAPRVLANILRYHWLLYRRTWRGSIVIGVANPALFLTGIGVGIGAMINRSGSAHIDTPFLTFLAPGIMAASAMQIGYADGGFNVYRAAAKGGSYTSAVHAPATATQLMVGQQLGAVLHNVIFSTCFYLVALTLHAVASPWSLLTVPASVLTGLAVSAPVAAWAVTVREVARIQAMFRIVIQPLYLLSGTFFPLAAAPPAVQRLAWLSPLWHGVEVCRDLNVGRIGAGTAVHAAVLAAVCAGGLLAARITYQRRLYR
jgi:ABC-type polysaccharide/polyol phosphate export permease